MSARRSLRCHVAVSPRVRPEQLAGLYGRRHDSGRTTPGRGRSEQRRGGRQLGVTVVTKECAANHASSRGVSMCDDSIDINVSAVLRPNFCVHCATHTRRVAASCGHMTGGKCSQARKGLEVQTPAMNGGCFLLEGSTPGPRRWWRAETHQEQ